MAKKVILGTDIARDAFKVKVNENFTELYDKDVALEGQINDLDADKANKAQGNWITATLQNGWTGALKYRKNDIGQLEIQGSIIPGTNAVWTVIAELPLEYRTASNIILPTYSSDAKPIYKIALRNNGTITVVPGLTNGDSIGDSTKSYIINSIVIMV